MCLHLIKGNLKISILSIYYVGLINNDIILVLLELLIKNRYHAVILSIKQQEKTNQ